MVWSKIQEASFANNERFKFYFWRKSRFYQRRHLINKVVTVEEELDEIDIDGVGNSLNLPRLMFIDEDCGNLKVLVSGG